MSLDHPGFVGFISFLFVAVFGTAFLMGVGLVPGSAMLWAVFSGVVFGMFISNATAVDYSPPQPPAIPIHIIVMGDVGKVVAHNYAEVGIRGTLLEGQTVRGRISAPLVRGSVKTERGSVLDYHDKSFDPDDINFIPNNFTADVDKLGTVKVHIQGKTHHVQAKRLRFAGGEIRALYENEGRKKDITQPHIRIPFLDKPETDDVPGHPVGTYLASKEPIKVVIEGSIPEIEIDHGKVGVAGKVNLAQTEKGNLTVLDTVLGNLSSVAGDVVADKIVGKISVGKQGL